MTMPEVKTSVDAIKQHINDSNLDLSELKQLRAFIGGKLSRRTLSVSDIEKMQKARKKKNRAEG